MRFNLNASSRVLAFVLAAVLQVGLLGYMVVDRAHLLRSGTEVMLETRPVDPRDFLRGDYVALSYDISSLPAGPLKDQPSNGNRSPVYVTLAPKGDGFYGAVGVHAEPVAVSDSEVLIRGNATYGADCGRSGRSFCDRLTIEYGIEQYFIPEGAGGAIERARNEGKVTVVAAVAPSGRAAIKRLLVNGEPVYEEPLF